jgi:uncharacterized membrane protein
MKDVENPLTFGEKISDKIAEFGGSWYFIISFFIFLMIWIILNLIFFIHPFDPYPFILLNLCLSCLASIQAPVILMSQNRQESRDRIRDEKEYIINQKAEMEIMQLHRKIDDIYFKIDRVNENLGKMEKEMFSLLKGQVIKKTDKVND